MEKKRILEVQRLVKEYTRTRAVDSIQFHVDEGEIVGLLGPNGAGKTTTISMILGVLTPTSGTIHILEKNIQETRSACAQVMNFAAVYAHVPPNMTVWQNLFVFGLLYSVSDLKKRITSLLKEYDLEQFSNTKVGVLSSGEQTRVALAKSILNRPKLLLLDEPTASLDPSSARLIRDSIRAHATTRKTAILWTSHNMHEVEAVCDRVLFLSHGNIILEGDPKTLPRKYGKDNLEELFITVAREPLSLEA